MGLSILVGLVLVFAIAYGVWRFWPEAAAEVLDTFDNIMDEFNTKVERLEALAARRALEADRLDSDIARLEVERNEADADRQKALEVARKFKLLTSQ